MENRRSFFKKACLSGACFCGFSSLVFSSNNKLSVSSQEEDKRLALVQEYLGELLLNMQANLSEEENQKAIKQLAQIHYAKLNMDEFLMPYENKIDAFIEFIGKEWGWKVTYDKSTQTIVADENKRECVCPMINHKTGIKPGALCYCSEGFSEKMFSKVAGRIATAKVISSIHRGNDRCRYEIKLS